MTPIEAIGLNMAALSLNMVAATMNFISYRRWRRLRERGAVPERPRNTGSGALICPTCGHDRWIEGPEGGMSQNLECGRCHVRFNHTPFGLQWIGHRSEDWFDSSGLFLSSAPTDVPNSYQLSREPRPVAPISQTNGGHRRIKI